MTDDLPTPRSTLRANYRVLVWCKACWHRAEVDLQRLIGCLVRCLLLLPGLSRAGASRRDIGNSAALTRF
jgi:hypothetical protein